MMSIFYEPGTSRSKIFQAVAMKVAILADTLDFPDEKGGEVTRELGIPYLPGADDVDVTAASLRFETNLIEREISFDAKANPDGKGVIVTAPQQIFLRSIEISYAAPAAPASPQVLRTVIRSATGKVQTPLLALPSFPTGEMYPPLMSGLEITPLSNGHLVLSCEGLLGTSWLIQIVAASTPIDMSPLAIVPAVHKVTAQAVPANLRIQMETDNGDVKLWANPGALLPAAGIQEVSMLALGKRQLQTLVKKPPAGTPPATLPLRIRFQSDSAGSLQIDRTQLDARYHAFAAGANPAPLTIGGDWTDWPLTAPARIKPESTVVSFQVKLTGIELNAGSPSPPVSAPSTGFQLTGNRWMAVAMPFLPLPGGAIGSILPLAAIRLYLAAADPAAALLEIRNDAAGNPGPLVTSAIPHRFKAGDRGWIDFTPKKPIPVSTGGAMLWLVLRTTQGIVSWYCAPPPDGAALTIAKTSSDSGKTWTLPARALNVSGDPLAQLYHARSDPQPAPSVKIFQSGSALPLADLFANAVRQSPREFTISQVALPIQVANRFAAAAGSGKTTLPFRLYSSSVGTLTVQQAIFVYDPQRVIA
jgi:hypothetical protein